MLARPDPRDNACGADLIVRNLVAHGVTHVFGIPGAKVDRLFDALVDSPIQTVVTRHEQNAAFIAGGIGRLTGKAGVALATSGPGASNFVTGLATANSEGDPVLAIGGAVKLADRLKLTHQTMDTVSLFKPITKYSAEINSPHAVSEVIANALRAAEGGRPGAAFVSTPMDILNSPESGRVLADRPAPEPGPAAARAIAEASRIIGKAAHPVILLGLMASRPEVAPAVRKLIAATGAPVVGTYQAAGAVSHELVDRFGGRVGLFRNQPGDQLLHEADLVIAVGYNPVEYDPELWNVDNRRQILHIDVVPAELDNHYAPDLELIGDIAATVNALAAVAPRLPRSERLEAILRGYKAERILGVCKCAQRQDRCAAPAGDRAGAREGHNAGRDDLPGHGDLSHLAGTVSAVLPSASDADQQWPADHGRWAPLGDRGEHSQSRPEGCLDFGRRRFHDVQHGTGDGRAPEVQPGARGLGRPGLQHGRDPGAEEVRPRAPVSISGRSTSRITRRPAGQRAWRSRRRPGSPRRCARRWKSKGRS